MWRMGLYDQFKKAFQDIVAPEIQRLEGRIDGMDGRLTAKIDAVDSRVTSLRTETISMKNELLAEIRRLDSRLDSVDRELHTAIEVRERLAALEARQRP